MWKVPLPNNPHYPYTSFHHRHEDEQGYAALIVNVEKNFLPAMRAKLAT